ncbi:helix-turn-helix transcriptional regulator [Pseudocolwellia agarivorans]|uniref:helix-turn-helix transcriptional regulator n=1 Tax=Pseudocolwellia agarivorans TaxID=1911682 RepID=UPI00098604AA|nr:AraC family transcriptional regulator [Pseudocolwellia agarivorans]
MESLINTIKNTMDENKKLPFTVYSSVKEQRILNVSIVKPLLIVVLSGTKILGVDNEIICQTGDFVFLSDSPSINLRNIPKNEEYFALLIDFDYQDINGFNIHTSHVKPYCLGSTTPVLYQCLQQFVESAMWAPESLWGLRKKELLELLCFMGHTEILSMFSNPKVSYKLHDIFSAQPEQEITLDVICDQLAMSESTLRRKLKAEGTSIQEIKDQTRLGLGLHLLQTTSNSIALIAEKCGYQSQSRFTERFKNRFGLTPSELRKTRMTD